MDPSKPFTATCKPPSGHPPPAAPPIDPSVSSSHLSYPSMDATHLPGTSSGFSSSSLLSPSDPPARSVVPQAHSAPRRIPSSSSLIDERRKSTPSLKKRSSTASLRSNHPNSGSSASPRPSLSRKSSSTFLGSSPTTAATHNSTYNMSSRKTSLPAALERLEPTPASIAADHFKREVEYHQSADLQSQTLVVVHDACYGHRFSRPRASKAALNSIVEKPERIQACVIGISAAYVRLARRYAGGHFAPHPDLNLHQLPTPPFQIRKTGRTLAVNSPAVTNVHGSKWMEDLKTMCDAAESRLALNGKELVRPNSTGKDSATAAATAPPLHEGDLYLCSESLDAFEGALGGVCEGVDSVFSPSPTKRAFVCIRPPGHHCSSGHPSGFCWINNVHVGISYAAMTHGLTHAAILDFDLHHGDGSQDIAWGQNQKANTAPRNAAGYKRTAIGYFSLHDINSYPCEMGEPEKVRNASVCIEKAHGQSIWNIHLESWKTQQEFWRLYNEKYSILIDKARDFLRLHSERLSSAPNGPAPRAAIFISAGFDASEWEGAGMQRHQVNVPTEFYAKFTADVVRMAEEEGLGVDGRIISVLEGGYSNRALITGVLSHLSGLGDMTSSPELANDLEVSRLATEMTDRLGLSDIPRPTEDQNPVFNAIYDSDWWSTPLLEELEALAYPPPLPPVSKPREKSAPTYFAPTQSFAAKVVLPSRERKSTGSQASLDLEAPPLPPVSWAVATHELSKVLIPSDRTTVSCRPEELNAEASRLRRERQAAATIDSTHYGTTAMPDEKGMKLRIRKPKMSSPNTPGGMETPRRQSQRNSRRTTIDSPSDLPGSSRSPGSRPTRRKSTASTPFTMTASSTPDPEGPNQRPSSRGVGSATSMRKPGTSQSTATPKRQSSPKKAPPVPRVPSSLLSNEAPSGVQSPESDTPRPLSASTSKSPQDDIESLAAGVKKLSIKLKVPSPEENAAREKKAMEDRKRRASKGTSKPTRSPRTVSGKASHANSASKENPLPHPSSEPQVLTPSPDIFLPAYPGQAMKLEDAQRCASSSPPASSPTPSAVVSARAESANMPVDAPSHASNIGMAISPPMTPGAIHDTSKPLAMLYSPPASIPMAKHGLPVFTSHGPIPFAPRSMSDDQTKQSGP